MSTAYHAKLFAHELMRRHSASDSEKLAGTLLDAQVDLNPHQVEAALFRKVSVRETICPLLNLATRQQRGGERAAGNVQNRERS